MKNESTVTLETVKQALSEVLEERGDGWYRVVYNGRSGYVNGRYLSETRP